MSSIATKTDGRTDHAETQAKPLIFFFCLSKDDQDREQERQQQRSGEAFALFQQRWQGRRRHY